MENREVLVPLISEILSSHPARHWQTLLEGCGVPVSPVNSIAAAFADPHVVARETVVHHERAGLGSVPGVRSPIRLREQDPEFFPNVFGENGDEPV